MDVREVSDLQRRSLSSVDRRVGSNHGSSCSALERHGHRVGLDLWVVAETQQSRAEDLGGLASQREIAQAGCDDGAFKGKCAIAYVLVFGLRGNFIRGSQANQQIQGNYTYRCSRA